MEDWSGVRLARALVVALWIASTGCTIAPKRFSDTVDLAPLVRARAATMGDHLPAEVVVPALLDRLNDPDPVVRLTAHEELKQRTRQDFGYEPWDSPQARAQATARWRAWWSQRTSSQSASGTASGETRPIQAQRAAGRPRPATTRVRHTLPHVPPTRG